MDIDLSTALATLKTDPADATALEALSKLRIGNGAGVDRETLRAALAGARGWHEEHGDLALCVQLVDLELGWTPTDSGRADLLVEKARLLHQELLRWEAARSALKEALEIAPGHRGAASLLASIEDEEGAWERTAQAKLAQARDAGSKPSAAPALALAGELYLKFRPKSDEGESFLRKSLELDPRQRRADALLERVLRDGRRSDDLMYLYKKRIATAPSADERVAAEVRAGLFCAELGRGDQALDLFRSALAASPAEPRALAWMARRLGAEGKGEDLAKVYESALRATKRGPAELELLVPLATLHWKQLRQMDQAELYFRRVRKAQPVHPTVIEFYREYHTLRNEIPQLVALLAQAQKAETDLETRVRLGIEMAELAEQRPQSLEKAIDAWKALLKLRPGLPQAVAALRRLYTQTEKWNALLELLKDDIEALPADAVYDKVARYLEMVPIYRDRLRLEVMVVNTYVAVLALRPDHAEALAALAERFEAQGRWADLVQIFSRQAESTTDVALKVKLHHRVATLWAEKFNKHQNAVAALEKILQLAPDDAGARASLREIYVRNRSWRALLELMRRELPLLAGEARRRQLAEMAHLAAERLADARQSIGLWNEVLALAPADADALAALAALYEREKRFPALAEVLARQAAAAGEGTAAWAALMERRGTLLHEKLGAVAAAAETLRAVLRLAPDSGRVLRALRDIYAETGDFAALEAIYLERGAFDELCEVLAGVADRTNDVALRVRLLWRVAELAEGKLRQPERALKAYESILASEPENRVAARAAATLYRATEKWPRLLATFEVLLGRGRGDGPAADGPARDEALAMLEEARRICEEKLGSKSLAFQWCARAYALSPADPAVVADLERLGEQADEWEALATIFAARLGESPPPDEQLRLLRRSLQIALGRLNRPMDARSFAEAILGLAPEDPEAETALQQVFTRGEAWADLVALLGQQQRRLRDPVARIEVLLRIARVQEEKLGDRAAAARTVGQAVDLDPAQLRTLRALARLREAAGDHAGLAEALRKEATLVPEDERAGVLLRLGKIEETALRDPAAARAAYLAALEADPIAAEAVAGLERLVDAGAVPQAELAIVCARLAPYYELRESYDKWARALEVLAEAAAEGERRGHLELLVDLYAGPLANPGAAYRAARRMYELDPHGLTQHERLIELATGAEALADLAATVRRVLDDTEEPGLRADLLGLIASVDEHRGGDGVAAERAYREILQLDPLHFASFRALTRRLREGERWSDLRDLLIARQAHLPEARDRLELLWQIAEIDEALLDDREGVIATLGKVLELAPTDLKAFRALDRHLTAAARWRDLDGLLAREAALVPPADADELALRRAELALAHFGDPAAALDLVAAVVAENPDSGKARALAEGMLEVPEVRARAAKMLEPLYEASALWQRLVAVLEVQREGQEGRAAVALLSRIAEIQESKLQGRVAALGTWRQVLQIEPGSSRALGEVERLTTILERFGEMADLYQELATRRGEDLRGAADLLARAARLYLARFGDRAAAIRVWRRILDLDRGHLETARPAADALEALYTETGDFRGLVEVLRAKAGWTDEGSERRALLLRIAALEEKSLGDAAAAIATYRTLLEDEPDHADALAELDRLYETTARPRERVEVLARRVAIATDPAVRRELRFRAAGLLDWELGDLDGAIAVLRAVLDDSPDDRAALEALGRLYAKKGAPSDRLEVLERQLALVGQGPERVEQLRAIAELLEGPLARPADALDRWREILAVTPRDPGAVAALEALVAGRPSDLRLAAAQSLEPIYEAGGAWEKLARLVRAYVDAAEDGPGRLAHLVRLAGLQETRLGDRAGAFASLGAAVREALGERQLRDLLAGYERLGAELGPERGAELVVLYRAIEPDVLDEQVRLQVQRTIARHAERQGDLPAAAEYHRKVLERLPEDTDALAALEGIYRRTDDAAALYDILLRRADLYSGREEVELPQRLQAGALALRLGKTDEALAAFERAFALRPGHPDATAALERLYTEGGQHAELGGLIERRLAAGLAEREGVGLRFQLARLELDRLGNRDRALEQLGAVLAGEPDHGEAIALLEGMLKDPETRVQAAALLEPVFVRRQSWTDLVEVDRIRLDESTDPAARLALMQRIARVYEEQIEDLDEAFRWYGRVFQETPTDAEAHGQLLRLAPKLGRWQEVGRLLGDYLEQELGNGDDVLEVVRLAAEVFDEQLGDRASARKYFRRYVEAQPGDRSACLVFEQALERWEAWRELRDLLDEQAVLVSAPEDRVALLKRSARLSEESLEARGDAIGALRGVLEADPGDAEAAGELERLLAAEGRWSDLRDHLVWMLERESEPGRQDPLALRIAEVELRRLDNASAAVDRVGEVLARTPGHPAALAGLEALLGNLDERARVAEMLEPLYRRAQEARKLVDVLEIRLETTVDPPGRVTLWREIASLEEGLGRLDRALEARGRAWLEEVADRQTLAELEQAANAQKRHARLAQILEQGAGDAGDPDLRAGLYALRARLLETRLGDPAQAIEAWRAALAARSDDLEAYLSLERLLAAAGRSAELCETIERHVEIVTDPEQRKALTKRIAVLHEQALRQRDKAIDAWRAVLELDDSDEEALDALVRLYGAAGSWRSLAEIYQRKIEMELDPPTVRLHRFTLARLYDEKLEEPYEATTQLRAVLDESAGDREALEGLDRIYTREGQHAELLEVLDLRVAGETNPGERDALAFRAARLVAGELGDVQGAVERYRQILGRTPKHAGAREALWTLARGEDHRALAVPVLEPVLRAEREWEALVELLELRLSIEDAAGPRLEVLAEIARVEEAERGDRGRAFAAWARAFAEDPGEQAARDALERLAAAGGEHARLAKVYEERLRASYDAELQRGLAWRLAELHEGALRDPVRAIEFWREVLTVPGDEVVALARLEALLRQLGRDAELEEVLGRESEAVNDPVAQAEFLAALGEVRLRRLGDVAGAVEAFREALARVPTHAAALAALRGLVGGRDARREVLDVLEPLAEARGDHAELVALYEARVQLLDEASERAEWLRRIAELAETRLHDPGRAIDALGRALREDPLTFSTADEIERVAAAAAMPGEAARRLEAVLELLEGSALVDLALRAARLHDQSAPSGSPGEEAAERLYGRVLEAEPDNAAALEAVEALYRRRGDAARLAAALERRGAIELDPERREAFYGEAARLHEERGDAAGAIAAWKAVREGDEANLRALGELARLYEREKQTEALVGVLEEKARFADDSGQRAALYIRIGELKAGPLRDRDGAAAAFREALDIAPQDLLALAALCSIEEERGDFAALEEALLRRLAATSGAEQVAVLFKLADNATRKLEDPDRALAYLHQILDADPGNRRAFDELERLLRGLERWHDLIDVLERRADLDAQAGDLKTELRSRVAVAEIWAVELGAPESALETVEKSLAREPAHVPSLLALARIHEAGESWAEAGEALARAAALAAPGRETADIQFRIGKVLAAQGAPAAEAEARYQAALAADGTHAEALEALEAIARAGGDVARLVDVLERRERVVTEEARRRSLLSEIAGLYLGPLGRPAGAVAPLERLARLVPADLGVQESLGRALAATGRVEEGERILLGLVDQMTKAKQPKNVARLQQALGGLAEARGDLATAEKRLAAAYQLEPTSAPTLAALGRLAVRQNDAAKAQRFYRSLLLQTFDEQAAGISKAEVYLALGRLHAQAGEKPKARNMFERGLEIDPQNAALKQALTEIGR